jgi:hypothetical protein
MITYPSSSLEVQIGSRNFSKFFENIKKRFLKFTFYCQKFFEYFLINIISYFFSTRIVSFLFSSFD